MKRKTLIGSLVLLVLAGAGTVLWYQTLYLGPRYSPAAREAVAALQGDAELRVERDRWIVLRPASSEPVTGLIFYPGGQVAPEGYTEPLRGIATAGFLVVVVPMPLDLAVLAPDRAEGVIGAFPAIRHWVIAGHSLGGAMAARFVDRHPGAVDGLLLWDAYPADDLSKQTLPVRQLHRLDADGLAPPSYRETDHLLPAQTERIPLPGASHLNYGRFIAAERFRAMPAGMVEASMPIEEQHARIVAATLDFLEGISAAKPGAAAAP